MSDANVPTLRCKECRAARDTIFGLCACGCALSVVTVSNRRPAVRADCLRDLVAEIERLNSLQASIANASEALERAMIVKWMRDGKIAWAGGVLGPLALANAIECGEHRRWHSEGDRGTRNTGGSTPK